MMKGPSHGGCNLVPLLLLEPKHQIDHNEGPGAEPAVVVVANALLVGCSVGERDVSLLV